MSEQYRPIAFAPYTAEQAGHRRERLLKKRADAMPLFEAAGVADQITPVAGVESIQAEIQAWNDAYVAQLNECQRQLVDLANSRRRQVADLVTPEQLAEMDAYRARVYPPAPEYGAEYWRRMLEKVKGEPGMEGEA